MTNVVQRKGVGRGYGAARGHLIYVCRKCGRNLGTRKLALCKYCGSKLLRVRAVGVKEPTCAFCGKKLKDDEIEKGTCNRCEAVTGIGHEEAF